MALHLFPELSKTIRLNDDTTYAYVFVAPSDQAQPTFLLLHGFASASFDWRLVIPLLRENGYGIICPDLLGYGDTDKPVEVGAYSLKRMSDHLNELVQKEDIGQVIGVGHDLGSGLLSFAALAHPSLFKGLVFSSVGYIPPGAFDVDQFNAMTEGILGYPTFGYWKFFDEEDAGSIIDANPASFVSLFYPERPEYWKTTMGPIGAAKAWLIESKTTPLPSWLDESDMQKRNAVFEQGGYTAPLNWYKGIMRKIDEPFASTLTTEESKSIALPALVIVGEEDYVCVPDFQKPTADAYLRNHRIERLQCGHHIQLEKPEELVSLLQNFVTSKFDAVD